MSDAIPGILGGRLHNAQVAHYNHSRSNSRYLQTDIEWMPTAPRAWIKAKGQLMDTHTPKDFKIERLPKELQETFRSLYANGHLNTDYLATGEIHHGDARELLPKIAPNSIALSVWSPPYFVGKEYEADLTFESWQHLLETVIALHFPIIKPGGFLVINIADILVFRDEAMPRVQADVVQSKRSPVTREDVLRAMTEYPELNRYGLAKLLGCSEQTIDRRLHGNNIRGGKYEPQTRVKIVGGLIEEWALKAGFYPYDRLRAETGAVC